jgi:hypothetical protein|tara:strand:- start:64 stop:294 length:231 start_codon:yes stop_codon:yes gene_type:complete
MKNDTIAEVIALLNTANYDTETLNQKRNEVVSTLKKQLSIQRVVNCLSCGKNHAELCGSCVSDIAQATGEQAQQSR